MLLPFCCAKAEDFDLSDIFAEYFQNEFDDPMNAYTSSMANYTGGAMANPMGSAQRMPQGNNVNNSTSGSANLPTGGIRTSFHYNAPNNPGAVEQPFIKKPRLDLQSTGANSGILANQSYQQHMPQIPQQAMQHPGLQFLTQQQQQQLQQQAVVQALAQQSMLQQSIGGPVVGGVTLPVGVGIRLGALVPSLVQSTTQTAGYPPQGQQFNPWGGGAPMRETADQGEGNVAERRQRNREHAKRSRVRKKFMLEALQSDVNELQKVNQSLRMLIQEHIPEHAMKIIAECCTSSPLFDDVDAGVDEQGKKREEQNLLKSDFNLMQTLTVGQQCFVLSDPKLPDNPIVFASPGFYKLTGYTSKEVLGRNCRFLQGPGTNRQAVEVIRQAVKTGSDSTVCLLNYKADGTPFWNQFFIASLRDSDNNIVNFVSTPSGRWSEASCARAPHRASHFSCLT
jgi:PAS domain S-box-containing protein